MGAWLPPIGQFPEMGVSASLIIMTRSRELSSATAILMALAFSRAGSMDVAISVFVRTVFLTLFVRDGFDI